MFSTLIYYKYLYFYSHYNISKYIQYFIYKQTAIKRYN